MKGKYVFDVAGLKTLQNLITNKAEQLGCTHTDNGEQEGDPKVVFVNLEKKTFTVYRNLTLSEYETRYGLADYTPISVQDFLRMEKPPVMVALSLFVTEETDWQDAIKEFGSDKARVAGISDIQQYAGQITRDDVMKAAEQACRALGV